MKWQQKHNLLRLHTQPCSPDPEVDSQIAHADRRACTHACMQPQTQQRVREYGKRCLMGARGEETRFHSNSPVKGQSHKTGVSGMVQPLVGNKSNARPQPSSKSRGATGFQSVLAFCLRRGGRSHVTDHVHITEPLLCSKHAFLNSYLPAKRKKTPCFSSSALLAQSMYSAGAARTLIKYHVWGQL